MVMFGSGRSGCIIGVLCVAEAVKNIIQFMGMQPCERSDKVPEDKSMHTLYLAGEYCFLGEDFLDKKQCCWLEVSEVTSCSLDLFVAIQHFEEEFR